MSTSLAFELPFRKAVEARLAEDIAIAIARANDADMPIEERVHKARLATKEMRALLRLVRPAFRDYREINTVLRDAARHLAHHRESAVRQKLLQELVAGADPDSGLAAFADRIEALAGVPPGLAEQEERLRAFSRDIGALAANTAIWRIEPKRWKCLAEGATRTYRAARQAMVDARVTGHSSDFHEWRKHVKYHYRHLLLLSPLDDGPSMRRCKKIARLGEMLGQHHDLEALLAHLKTEAGLSAEEYKVFRRAIDPLQSGIARSAVRFGAERFQKKPGAFERRVLKAIKRGTNGRSVK